MSTADRRVWRQPRELCRWMCFSGVLHWPDHELRELCSHLMCEHLLDVELADIAGEKKLVFRPAKGVSSVTIRSDVRRRVKAERAARLLATMRGE